jgi:hypothetical protein
LEALFRVQAFGRTCKGIFPPNTALFHFEMGWEGDEIAHFHCYILKPSGILMQRCGGNKEGGCLKRELSKTSGLREKTGINNRCMERCKKCL